MILLAVPRFLRLSALLVVLFVLLASLGGCATTGGPRSAETAALSRIAIQGVTITAVGRVVTRDNATPADVERRAQRIVIVATALQSLGDDALASLPQVTAALAPLLDRLELTPLERQQADLLVQALVAVALERTDADRYIATINLLLSDVIRAASGYLPAAEPERPTG